jgi:hypothetical protein
MAAFTVTAYQGTRNWLHRQPAFAETVRDCPGLPPARAQAAALQAVLAERDRRLGLGWTHVTVTAA